jgi:hypothetical protein
MNQITATSPINTTLSLISKRSTASSEPSLKNLAHVGSPPLSSFPALLSISSRLVSVASSKLAFIFVFCTPAPDVEYTWREEYFLTVEEMIESGHLFLHILWMSYMYSMPDRWVETPEPGPDADWNRSVYTIDCEMAHTSSCVFGVVY